MSEKQGEYSAEKKRNLSLKHEVFVSAWCSCFNGTDAYQIAYPKASRATARANAADLLANTDIQEEIRDRLAKIHMGSDEALSILAVHARGDIGQLMDITPLGFSLDMQKAKDLGLTKLIKKVKQRVVTHIAKSESDEDREVVDLEIELYDSQAAIEKILKATGKAGSDKLEIVVKYANDSKPTTPA
jgi:hypothetical protein